MTNHVLTPRATLQQVVELLVTSLHHIPDNEPALKSDTYAEINKLQAALAAPCEPVVTVVGRDQYQEVSGEISKQIAVGTVLYAAPKEPTT